MRVEATRHHGCGFGAVPCHALEPEGLELARRGADANNARIAAEGEAIRGWRAGGAGHGRNARQAAGWLEPTRSWRTTGSCLMW